MPPKKAKKRPPPAPPLHGCTIALSGSFGMAQGVIEETYLEPLGASLAKSVNANTSHLVTTEADFNKPSAKVKAAKTNGVSIINLNWLEDCLAQSSRLNERDYGFDVPDDDAGAAPATNAQPQLQPGKTNGSRKRPVTSADTGASDEESQPQPKKKAKADSQTESKIPEIGAAQIAQKGTLIPLDEACPLTHYAVYTDGAGIIYDASLNQTNAGQNNNKFYRVQLLHNGGDYKTWTRWGRVGERGQTATLGGGCLDDAMKNFLKKFKNKSGLSWTDRGASPKAGKYTFVERSYDPDSEEEDGDEDSNNVKTEDDLEVPQSKLTPAVQELMELIFDPQYFAATMSDLNYDAKKLPLGKLSKTTITRGYQTLKDLSALLDNSNLAQTQYGTSWPEATEMLSNTYFSLIPHAFGRSRPPVIRDHTLLKREAELLDSLSDLKDAAGIMNVKKDVERLHTLDRQFQGLGLDEMTPLKSDSAEFRELKNYLTETRGQTHCVNYQISQIFRIERQGEKDRFESQFAGPPKDRRLLWHGSRATNFGGILSQGLRIAPPEAPATGYMFGKGIYLADMSSKSANYCYSYITGGHALLLLCEAELGNPLQILTNASYNADANAKAKGMLSTWGQGITGPSLWKDAECVHPSLKGVKMPDVTVKPGNTEVHNAYLQYNEYIAYNVQQVRLRYLLRVKM
ncbi:poly polymerase catalytic domain-containing protein [Pseudomassariella vexata]|uniref:Poly [ADP-ribose] polymerase n=1 Tax=Pseudomassariella vexata TaxID=1141098 RepID=A0A1Y2DSJ2_9PEZI|nr:poly polymerase catalytic domain-containing protein [Pseudomassariella vexata]ORY62232.1 poly polymerase catalytic domain-domain-containing protein [Pseudomassariella vexata]